MSEIGIGLYYNIVYYNNGTWRFGNDYQMQHLDNKFKIFIIINLEVLHPLDHIF